MGFSKLVIYVIVHGIDSVNSHLDTLESAGISPDLVALELADVEDVDADIESRFKELVKRSPATAFVWWVVKYFNEKEYREAADTADRADAEFAAGRQYADQHDLPCVHVDLSSAEMAQRYATPYRVIRDNTVFSIGAIVTILLWLYAGGALSHGLGSFLNAEYVDTGIDLVLTTMAAILGLVVVKLVIEKMAIWFLTTIRDLRDEAIYSRLKKACATNDSDTALLIVGGGHGAGIKSKAESDGIDCRVIESPAVTRFCGDIHEIAQSGMDEFIES